MILVKYDWLPRGFKVNEDFSTLSVKSPPVALRRDHSVERRAMRPTWDCASTYSPVPPSDIEWPYEEQMIKTAPQKECDPERSRVVVSAQTHGLLDISIT